MFEGITPVMATIGVAIFGAFSWISYNHQEEFKKYIAPIVGGFAFLYLFVEFISWGGYLRAYFDFYSAFDLESLAKVDEAKEAARSASNSRWQIGLFFFFMIGILEIFASFGIVKKTLPKPKDKR